MSEWLTPIQKIILVIAISALVGGGLYVAYSNYLASETPKIKTPDYTTENFIDTKTVSYDNLKFDNSSYTIIV